MSLEALEIPQRQKCQHSQHGHWILSLLPAQEWFYTHEHSYDFCLCSPVIYSNEFSWLYLAKYKQTSSLIYTSVKTCCMFMWKSGIFSFTSCLTAHSYSFCIFVAFCGIPVSTHTSSPNHMPCEPVVHSRVSVFVFVFVWNTLSVPLGGKKIIFTGIPRI